MAPSAITPPQEVQQTAGVTAAVVAQKLAKTSPVLVNQTRYVLATLMIDLERPSYRWGNNVSDDFMVARFNLLMPRY
jgi:hypothetical protein